jgi:hypothetical protein
LVNATPDIPLENRISPATAAVKVATPDLMISNNEPINPSQVEIMTELIFEDIGGQELINIARNDIVNGQNIAYHPIKNLLDINFQYNPKNILSLENTSETFFNNFPIKLDTHIPNVGNGPDGENVYISDLTGDLVVELVNMQVGEQVEVEILVTGGLLDDTIYGGES